MPKVSASSGVAGEHGPAGDVPSYVPVLPPGEPHLPPRVQGALCLAENAAGELNQALRRVPDPEAFVASLRLREALRSARLTDLTAMPTEVWVVALRLPTLDDAGDAGDPAADGGSPALRHPVGRFVHGSALLDREVARGGHNGVALLGAVSAVLTGRPASPAARGLRQAEGFLTAGDRRTPYVRTAPPGEPLARAVRAWDRWVAQPYEGPRLAKIATAHLLLELLQPYPWANGHLARQFTRGEVVRRGVVDRPVLSLSPWLDDHADEYRSRIRAVVAGGPPWEWVEFFALAVREQALRNVALIDRLADVRAELVDRAWASRPARRVLAALPTSPVTDVPTLAAQHGLPTRGAAAILRRLEAEGVLRKPPGHPVKVFVCDAALDALVFDDLPPPTDRQVLEPAPGAGADENHTREEQK